MASAVTVHGADRAAANMRRRALRAANQQPVLDAASRRTAARITGIPVRTGRLEGSVRRGVDADAQGFVIRSDVPYARFVFGGTSKMPARPPVVPSNVGAEVARASLEWVTG
jgi:hypothetical protein